MTPNYRKGEKVQVYSPGQQIIRVIAEVRPKGETWEYSLLNPDTGKLCHVNFGGGRSKVDWQEERWLHPLR
jgi:hypothetical protein